MVPQIHPEDLVRFVRNLNAAADVGWRTLNPQYSSWEMDIRIGDVHLEVFWGPLSGFGGTDRQEESRLANLVDYNPFAPFADAFANLDDAKEWIRRRITER